MLKKTKTNTMCYCVHSKSCIFDDGLIGDPNTPCSHYQSCSHDPELEVKRYLEYCKETGKLPIVDEAVKEGRVIRFPEEISDELPF